jgi:4-hydroxybenzoate polyprenyltransferase
MASANPNEVDYGLFQALVRLARPHHWIKNVFVVAPVPFSLAAGGVWDPIALALGFFGFCLLSSGIYALNDTLDARADRLHPRKRLRPVAAGIVSPRLAIAAAVVLGTLGFALLQAVDKPGTVFVGATYVALNLLYNVGGKRMPLLDVFLLASGFVLRVILGCLLVAVAPSAWILLCTAALALFLGFAKRRADLSDGLDAEHRRSLAGYNRSFLDQALAICAGIAVLAYALYSIDSEVFVVGRELASLPFVAFAVFDYLRQSGLGIIGGSPVEAAFKSRSMQVCAIGWVLAVVWSLGLW